MTGWVHQVWPGSEKKGKKGKEEEKEGEKKEDQVDGHSHGKVFVKRVSGRTVVIAVLPRNHGSDTSRKMTSQVNLEPFAGQFYMTFQSKLLPPDLCLCLSVCLSETGVGWCMFRENGRLRGVTNKRRSSFTPVFGECEL